MPMSSWHINHDKEDNDKMLQYDWAASKNKVEIMTSRQHCKDRQRKIVYMFFHNQKQKTPNESQAIAVVSI